jgi:putative SOS response-associated peptidase YedK
MCNRYGYTHPFEKLRDEFSQTGILLRWSTGHASNLEPRDKITIRDTAPVVHLARAAEADLAMLPWAWKSPKGTPVFNFRSEGRDFRSSERVLIPASVFYEFTGQGSPKTAWRFQLAASDLMMIAGIVREGAFTMLTTAPGPDVAPLHDRQIVVLTGRDAWKAWMEDAELPPPLPAGTLTVEKV